MPNVYKVVPVGDGSLYGWNKYNENGDILENGPQYYPSAADAEKELRTLVTGDDRIEVEQKSNVNKDSNKNVDIVVGPEEDDRHAGMRPVKKSVEERGKEVQEGKRDRKDLDKEDEESHLKDTITRREIDQ